MSTRQPTFASSNVASSGSMAPLLRVKSRKRSFSCVKSTSRMASKTASSPSYRVLWRMRWSIGLIWRGALILPRRKSSFAAKWELIYSRDSVWTIIVDRMNCWKWSWTSQSHAPLIRPTHRSGCQIRHGPGHQISWWASVWATCTPGRSDRSIRIWQRSWWLSGFTRIIIMNNKHNCTKISSIYIYSY